MRRYVAITALLVSICSARGAPGAEHIRIVEEGKPLAAVVVPADASRQDLAAANLLARYVNASSGAELPVVDESKLAESSPTVRVHVGQTERVKRLDLGLDRMDDDGFVIKGVDYANIAIVGPTDYGTEYGVYEFLERYVGIRWLMPGEDGDDVPEHATIDVSIEEVRQEPAFFSRLFSGLRTDAQRTWARRNRMHGRVSFHHNLLRLFPPETYTRTHPHFFPVIKSRQKGEGHGPDGRFLPPTNDTHGWQPCFAATGMVEEAIKNICAHFDEHPHASSYSLGVNDSSGHCECERCGSRDTGETNFLGRRDVSDSYFGWCNRVVEGVLRRHPGKVFGCLAYSEIAQPPARVKVHPAVIPFMTYDRMKWVDPELRTEGEAMTKRWREACPTIGWYDYIYGSAYCVPRVWFHHMADYYRFAHANGVRALYAEAYPNWGEGPKLYVSLKLQWDPHLDVDVLLRDWYVRAVGEDAADDLAAYYAHWEDFWTRRILGSKWFRKHGQYLPFGNPSYLADVSEDEVAECRARLERVVERAGTPKQKTRARLLLHAFEYYEASVIAYAATAESSRQSIRNESEALGVLAASERYVHMAEKRKRLATEVFPKHPVLRHGSGWDRLPLVRGENWTAGLPWTALSWALQSDGPLRKRVREIAAREHHLLSDHARLTLAMIDGRPKPLSGNPSFEAADGNWPKPWSRWVKWGTGAMSPSPDAARTGNLGILCRGVKRGGPHQVLPVAPGRYGAVAFVRVPHKPAGDATVTLGMTLLDEDGTNLPSDHLSASIRAIAGDWTPIAVAGNVPANVDGKTVTSARLIVIVDGFAPQDEVHIDDVAVFRL